MVRSIQDLNDTVRLLEQQVRQLRLDMQKVSGGGTRVTNFTGVLQPENGGTGVTCDIKGAVTLWSNNSGATRTAGDVVVENGDRTFTTTTVVGNRLVIGVVEDTSVAAAINGCIRHTGYQAGVKVQGTVTAGDYLRTSATAGRAESAGVTPVDGAFAIALTANGGGAGTVNAMLLGGSVHQTVPAASTVSHDHTAAGGDGGIQTNDEHDGFSEYAEIAAPASPAADKLRVYAKDVAGTTRYFYKRSDGTEVELGAAGALSSHDHTATGGDGGVLTNAEHDGYDEFAEIAAPSTPAANKARFYAKDVGGVTKPMWQDDTGTETDLTTDTAGSGSGDDVLALAFAVALGG